jgi:hypothetical protein
MPQPSTLRLILNAAALVAASPTLLSLQRLVECRALETLNGTSLIDCVAMAFQPQCSAPRRIVRGRGIYSVYVCLLLQYLLP